MQFGNDLSRAVRVNLHPQDYVQISNYANTNRISISAAIRLGVLELLKKTAA